MGDFRNASRACEGLWKKTEFAMPGYINYRKAGCSPKRVTRPAGRVAADVRSMDTRWGLIQENTLACPATT